MKREGVLKGVPDLCIPEPMKDYHGLYIEMKSEKGRLEHEQVLMGTALITRGYKVIVINKFEKFQDEVIRYFTIK